VSEIGFLLLLIICLDARSESVKEVLIPNVGKNQVVTIAFNGIEQVGQRQKIESLNGGSFEKLTSIFMSNAHSSERVCSRYSKEQVKNEICIYK
jgi:hypothetical protein